jgi:hypothetical protein
MMARIALALLLSPLLAAAQQQGSTYSVNFISIGTGVDSKAIDELLAFHQSFEKEVKHQVPYTVRHWGREGETDYRFDLKALTAKQRKVFREKVKKLFEKNSRVDLSGTL